MSALVVLGASGFLGRALVASRLSPLPIKAVARSTPGTPDLAKDGVTWFAADLLDPRSLDAILGRGDVVLNMVFTHGRSEINNGIICDNLIEACVRCRVARLVHCSTAVVVGATLESRVSELTPCRPLTNYERTKLALERQVLSDRLAGVDVGILRPTAVIGPGGANLVKLARSLQHQTPIVTYARASVFGTRPMHLVPLRDVVDAFLHLAFLQTPLNKNAFIISADDDSDNNYQSVEAILLESLGLPPRKWPLVPVSPRALSALLRLLGRSDTTKDRKYDSSKLRATGFVPRQSIFDSVCEFGVSLKENS